MLSIGYAAPELIHALEAGERSVVADPSMDMWALGVIAYELLTCTSVFPYGESKQGAMDQLAGRKQLPWETSDKDEKLSRLRRLKGTVLQLLHRDPAQRPTAKQVVNSWNHFFDSTTAETMEAPPPA